VDDEIGEMDGDDDVAAVVDLDVVVFVLRRRLRTTGADDNGWPSMLL
jgi:hypothetical protein